MLTIEHVRRLRELNQSHVSPAQEAVELLILSVPTGPERETLTDLNIHLMAAQEIMRELSK